MLFILVLLNFPEASGTLSVYSDGIGSGFEDWSWSGNYNPADTQYVRTGSYLFVVFILLFYYCS